MCWWEFIALVIISKVPQVIIIISSTGGILKVVCVYVIGIVIDFYIKIWGIKGGIYFLKLIEGVNPTWVYLLATQALSTLLSESKIKIETVFCSKRW